MTESPFRHYDPFKKNHDLIYEHIRLTKRITWDYQYFIIFIILSYTFIYHILKLYEKKTRSSSSSPIFGNFENWLQSSPSNKFISELFISNSNLSIIFVFYSINLCLLFYKLPFDDSFNFALRTGLIAGSNLPLLYIIPLKNGPLLYLFNQSYENIIIFHKFLGVFVIGMASLHMIGFSYTLTWKFAFSDHRSTTGFYSIFWFLLIAISSISFIRTKWYEIFKFLHYSSFWIFLPIFYNHHYVCKPFVLTIIFFLTIDRLLIWFKKLWVVQLDEVITGHDQDLMLIKINTSIKNLTFLSKVFSYLLFKFNNSKFHYQLSNHLFITIPQISLYQSHPFTIASSPASDKEILLLIVKIHKGFTKKLSQYYLDHPNSKLSCLINGPYGNSYEKLPKLLDYQITIDQLTALKTDEPIRFSHDYGSINLDEISTILSKNQQTLKSFPSKTNQLTKLAKEKIILIAGGAGVALIYPMLYHYSLYPHNFNVSFIWVLRNEQTIVEFDDHDNCDSRTVDLWHTSKDGRPIISKLLSDTIDRDYKKIHIISCGPNSLMNDVKNFATNHFKLKGTKINLIIEEFSF